MVNPHPSESPRENLARIQRFPALFASSFHKDQLGPRRKELPKKAELTDYLPAGLAWRFLGMAFDFHHSHIQLNPFRIMSHRFFGFLQRVKHINRNSAPVIHLQYFIFCRQIGIRNGHCNGTTARGTTRLPASTLVRGFDSGFTRRAGEGNRHGRSPKNPVAAVWAGVNGRYFHVTSLLPQRRLRRRQPRNRHPERAAAHIIEPDPMAELHRVRFAAVFAADADF